MENTYLSHHGIKGQRWGVRRFQNEDGSLTRAGIRREAYTNANDRIKGELTKSRSGKQKAFDIIRQRKRQITNEELIKSNITNREKRKAAMTPRQRSTRRRQAQILVGAVGAITVAAYMRAHPPIGSARSIGKILDANGRKAYNMTKNVVYTVPKV